MLVNFSAIRFVLSPPLGLYPLGVVFKVYPNDDMESLANIKVHLFYLIGQVAFCATSVKYIGTQSFDVLDTSTE